MKNSVIMLALVASLTFAYFSIDFDSLMSYEQKDVKFITQHHDCDLHTGPCQIVLENGSSFELEVSEKDIPLMKPVKFTVITNNYNKSTLPLHIYATNMHMGIQNFEFKKVKENVYESNVILPTCIKGNMKWNAEIILEESQKRVGAKFQFKTEH
ncbi:hypothetical protein DZA31_00730 [Arcobacter sp. HD9-500m-PIT-SAG02]|nr:hypothetical protein DZA31_00730 [Arcobacter sp. HD9-500m-PIT-SAG02]